MNIFKTFLGTICVFVVIEFVNNTYNSILIFIDHPFSLMYKLEKTILAAFVLAFLVTTGSTAQTIKKTTKPATAVKKAPAAPVKAAATPAVLKNQMDSLSAAIGVSFSNSLSSQGITDINTEILTKTINASLKGGKTAFTPEDANKFIGEYFKKISEEEGAVFRVEGEKF